MAPDLRVNVKYIYCKRQKRPFPYELISDPVQSVNKSIIQWGCGSVLLDFAHSNKVQLLNSIDFYHLRVYLYIDRTLCYNYGPRILMLSTATRVYDESEPLPPSWPKIESECGRNRMQSICPASSLSAQSVHIPFPSPPTQLKSCYRLDYLLAKLRRKSEKWTQKKKVESNPEPIF